MKGRKLLLCLCGSNPANLCTPSAAAGALAPAPASDNDTTNEVVDLDTDELLSAFDLEVLQGVRSFNNRAAELLRISLPAFITLALSPLALYVHGTLTEVLWPADQGFKVTISVLKFFQHVLFRLHGIEYNSVILNHK